MKGVTMSKFPDVLYIFESRITGLFRSEKKVLQYVESFRYDIAEAAERQTDGRLW